MDFATAELLLGLIIGLISGASSSLLIVHKIFIQPMRGDLKDTKENIGKVANEHKHEIDALKDKTASHEAMFAEINAKLDILLSKKK